LKSFFFIVFELSKMFSRVAAYNGPTPVDVNLHRHSLRADCDPDETVRATVTTRIHDTPLSPAGIGRIHEKGAPPTQYIWCSDLWRCIQTAVEIQKHCGGIIIIDGDLGEVKHPKVLKRPVEEFDVLDDNEVRKLTQNFIRLDSPEVQEETRGLGGSADARYRGALTRIAKWCMKRDVTEVTVISHGDSLGSLAAMCNKELYSVEEFGRITATYNGTWTYKSSRDVGIIDA
jgi:broad specificity phosphatase PhoE